MPSRKKALGKLAPKEDPRDLLFMAYVDPDVLLPEVPTHASWARRLKSFPLYRNDTLPDCTVAAVAHAERVFTAAAGEPEEPTEEEVMEMFEATGPVDEGRYMTDILNRWRNVGFGTDREKIFAYVNVDVRNREEVEAAIWLFGGIYLGLALPRTARTQKRWSVVAKSGNAGAPGSWGGHAVWCPDFTKMRGPSCITWGARMNMTWGFFNRYADEAFAVISPDWATGEREAPNGLHLDALQTDLNQIGG